MDGDGELVIDAVKAFTLVLSRQAETEGFESLIQILKKQVIYKNHRIKEIAHSDYFLTRL